MFIASVMLASPSLLFTAETVTANAHYIICRSMPDGAKEDCVESADEGRGGVTGLVDKATDLLWAIISAVSVLVIIIAGFMYVTSAGNPDKTKKAKNAIMYALIGLVVAILARTIVQFVLSSV